MSDYSTMSQKHHLQVLIVISETITSTFCLKTFFKMNFDKMFTYLTLYLWHINNVKINFLMTYSQSTRLSYNLYMTPRWWLLLIYLIYEINHLRANRCDISATKTEEEKNEGKLKQHEEEKECSLSTFFSSNSSVLVSFG